MISVLVVTSVIRIVKCSVAVFYGIQMYWSVYVTNLEICLERIVGLKDRIRF